MRYTFKQHEESDSCTRYRRMWTEEVAATLVFGKTKTRKSKEKMCAGERTLRANKETASLGRGVGPDIQGAQLGMNGVDQAWWEQPMEARGRSEAREVRLLREILSWRWGRAARGMDAYVCIWSHMETGSLKEGDSISTGKGSRAHGSHRVKVRGWGRRIDKRAWGLPVLNAAIAKSAWATDCNTLGGGGTFSQFRMPCVSRESKETQSLLLARLWRELLSLAPAERTQHTTQGSSTFLPVQIVMGHFQCGKV